MNKLILEFFFNSFKNFFFTFNKCTAYYLEHDPKDLKTAPTNADQPDLAKFAEATKNAHLANADLTKFAEATKDAHLADADQDVKCADQDAKP